MLSSSEGKRREGKLVLPLDQGRISDSKAQDMEKGYGVVLCQVFVPFPYAPSIRGKCSRLVDEDG